MTKPDVHQVLQQVKSYADARGISVSTVCQYALGSWRQAERLPRKQEEIDRAVEKLRAFMKDNPAQSDGIVAE
ncbi:hypothetical protein [Mangrovicoccus ximenensis]|uniref:hypothetical protein n=1 Tax=Mangrovicoccus ximenensis TaxID=1911570 RepID=UPI001F42A6DE|nr:hypothetical protein [Mangrovicoccus ximenensis]